LTVGDDDALAAMAHAFLRLKLVAEPGGAVALAAALFRGEEIEGDAVIAVVTGGNVDPAMFARALETLG
ncbi:MAG: threonine/serine dehydratase, partial [Pseudomonadota bacterium]